MPAAPLFPADDPARAAPPARVHVGKPEDLFPTPFVGQRVALRSLSRGPEVRLFTVAKVFAADGDVVAELERVGSSGPSTERFDVLWGVREDTVIVRSHLPPEVAEAFDNGYREHDVEAMPWHALPPPSAVIPPVVTAEQTSAFIDGVKTFIDSVQKSPSAGYQGIELRGGVPKMRVLNQSGSRTCCHPLRVVQLTAGDVAAYRALAPAGAEAALRRAYPAANGQAGAAVLSLGRFPGLEPYVGSCPDWAALDPVGEAARVPFASLTARISTVGHTVVLQVAPWQVPWAEGDQIPQLDAEGWMPVELCVGEDDDNADVNAFLAKIPLPTTYPSKHDSVVAELEGLPDTAIVSKPFVGSFLTRSCTWRPDCKLLRGTEYAGLRLDQPGHAMARACNQNATPFDGTKAAKEQFGPLYKALVADVEGCLGAIAARQFWLCDFGGVVHREQEWKDIQGNTKMKCKNGSVLRSWGQGSTWAQNQAELDSFYDKRGNQELLHQRPRLSLAELKEADADAQDIHIDMDAASLQARNGYILSALLTTSQTAALRVLGRGGTPKDVALSANTLHVFTGAMAHGAVAYHKTNTRVFWYAVREHDDNGEKHPLGKTPSTFFDVTNFLDGDVFVEDNDHYKIWPMTVGVGAIMPAKLPAGTAAEGDGLTVRREEEASEEEDEPAKKKPRAA